MVYKTCLLLMMNTIVKQEKSTFSQKLFLLKQAKALVPEPFILKFTLIIYFKQNIVNYLASKLLVISRYFFAKSTLRVNPNVKYELWVIRFVNFCSLIAKHVPLCCGMLRVGEIMCVGEGSRRYMITVLSTQFCFETKSAPKNKVY